MITDLKNIANEMANMRVRLLTPFQGKQTREDIIKEAKHLENIESQLRLIAIKFKDELKKLSE